MEKIENEDVRIVAPLELKKKWAAIAKKPRKKNMKVEEDEELSSKNWNDRALKTMILLCDKMEPIFLKNAEKRCEIFSYLKLLKKNFKFQIWPIWPCHKSPNPPFPSNGL